MSPEPLILLHGLTASADAWAPVRPLLEAEADVWAPTMIGHRGGPPIPPGRPFTLASLADDLERRMDERGLDTAFVAGNSLGGWVALELAARGRARAVACLAPAGGWRPGSAFEVQLVTTFLVGHTLARAVSPGFWTRPRVRKEFLSGVVARPEHVPTDTVAGIGADLAGCVAVPALIRRRSNYAFVPGGEPRCPVTIAWSERDQMLPADKARARFTELAPGARQLELSGVGHVPMSDAPELVAQTILEATTTLPRPSSASPASIRSSSP